MVQLLILADDLTGCMDTGVQFAKAGIRTRVCLFSDINEAVMGQCDAPVMVIDTESRAPFCGGGGPSDYETHPPGCAGRDLLFI